ncbi:MAG TPA: hypothetical protein PKJ83_12125 [Cyclobacteriaceae bacterium]|nr:hypothetical protein [Cyclobacteriaceae bacterium]HPW62079.1 hypothetical protein [Cyclobacteriaceae bacterium]
MKNIFAITALVLISLATQAQSSNDLMISGGFDLIKTDFNNPFEKAQIGLEANYFVVRNFSAGAGVDIWTDQKSSFVMGARWYPMDNVFLRFRGLIGANDAAVGGGWAKPLNENWRFEAMGDFFFSHTEFAVRVGVSYIIKKK